MHMHVAARMVEEYLDGALNVRNIRGSHPQQKPAVIQLLPLMAPSEVGDVPSPVYDGLLCLHQLAWRRRQNT